MFQQIVSLAGNRLGDLDSTGNVSDSATPTTNIGTMNALYYDQTANKTYIQVGYPGILFATNETLYWSPSNFASSGTWVQMTGSTTEQIYVPPQSTINRRIPINLTLGPSTTATDLRLKVQGSQTAQSGISALIKDFAGTISNIS